MAPAKTISPGQQQDRPEKRRRREMLTGKKIVNEIVSDNQGTVTAHLLNEHELLSPISTFPVECNVPHLTRPKNFSTIGSNLNWLVVDMNKVNIANQDTTSSKQDAKQNFARGSGGASIKSSAMTPLSKEVHKNNPFTHVAYEELFQESRMFTSPTTYLLHIIYTTALCGWTTDTTTNPFLPCWNYIHLGVFYYTDTRSNTIHVAISPSLLYIAGGISYVPTCLFKMISAANNNNVRSVSTASIGNRYIVGLSEYFLWNMVIVMFTILEKVKYLRPTHPDTVWNIDTWYRDPETTDVSVIVDHIRWEMDKTYRVTRNDGDLSALYSVITNNYYTFSTVNQFTYDNMNYVMMYNGTEILPSAEYFTLLFKGTSGIPNLVDLGVSITGPISYMNITLFPSATFYHIGMLALFLHRNYNAFSLVTDYDNYYSSCYRSPNTYPRMFHYFGKKQILSTYFANTINESDPNLTEPNQLLQQDHNRTTLSAIQEQIKDLKVSIRPKVSGNYTLCYSDELMSHFEAEFKREKIVLISSLLIDSANDSSVYDCNPFFINTIYEFVSRSVDSQTPPTEHPYYVDYANDKAIVVSEQDMNNLNTLWRDALDYPEKYYSYGKTMASIRGLFSNDDDGRIISELEAVFNQYNNPNNRPSNTIYGCGDCITKLVASLKFYENAVHLNTIPQSKLVLMSGVHFLPGYILTIWKNILYSCSSKGSMISSNCIPIVAVDNTFIYQTLPSNEDHASNIISYYKRIVLDTQRFHVPSVMPEQLYTEAVAGVGSFEVYNNDTDIARAFHTLIDEFPKYVKLAGWHPLIDTPVRNLNPIFQSYYLPLAEYIHASVFDLFVPSLTTYNNANSYTYFLSGPSVLQSIVSNSSSASISDNYAAVFPCSKNVKVFNTMSIRVSNFNDPLTKTAHGGLPSPNSQPGDRYLLNTKSDVNGIVYKDNETVLIDNKQWPIPMRNKVSISDNNRDNMVTAFGEKPFTTAAMIFTMHESQTLLPLSVSINRNAIYLPPALFGNSAPLRILLYLISQKLLYDAENDITGNYNAKPNYAPFFISVGDRGFKSYGLMDNSVYDNEDEIKKSYKILFNQIADAYSYSGTNIIGTSINNPGRVNPSNPLYFKAADYISNALLNTDVGDAKLINNAVNTFFTTSPDALPAVYKSSDDKSYVCSEYAQLLARKWGMSGAINVTQPVNAAIPDTTLENLGYNFKLILNQESQSDTNTVIAITPSIKTYPVFETSTTKCQVVVFDFHIMAGVNADSIDDGGLSVWNSYYYLT